MEDQAKLVPAGQNGGQHAAPLQQTPKTWVIWMLFGLGWASLLMFGMSLIPFPGGVKWALWASGWAFVGCWWAGTAMGASHSSNRRMKAAWTSCFIMAIIGTAIGAVPSLAAVLYRNWYVVQSIVVAALVYGALQAYSQSKEAGTGEGAGVAAVAPTAAAEPQ